MRFVFAQWRRISESKPAIHLGILILFSVLSVLLVYQLRLPVRIDVGDPDESWLSGFYTTQTDGDYSFRWTKQDAEIRFPNVGYSAPLVLNLKAYALRFEDQIYTATVTVNNFPVGEITRAGWREWRFVLPNTDSLHTDDVIVRIHATSFVHNEIYSGSNDERRLGIGIASAEIQPQWNNDAGKRWSDWLVIPALAQIVFALVLVLGIYLAARFSGVREEYAFGIGIGVAVFFALEIAFFRLASSQHILILTIVLGAMAAARIFYTVHENAERENALPGPVHLRQGVAVITLLGAMTILLTWPLALQIDHQVIGWKDDHFYFVWLVAWYQKALFTLGVAPFQVPFLNYPEGWNLAYTDATPAMVLIALPFSLVGSPTLGYNMSILCSFILSGLAVYLWTLRFTNNRLAGVIGGSIFAFAPYRLSHAWAGHLSLVGTQWLAFYFLTLYHLLAKRQPMWKDFLLPGLFLGLTAATSPYYLYMSLVITVGFVAGFAYLNRPQPVFEFVKKLSTSALIALPCMVVPLGPYIQLATQGHLAQRSLESVRQWSASPTDFILPSVTHPIWGDIIKHLLSRNLWSENTLYLGVVCLAFVILAIAKRNQMETSKVILLLSITSALAFVLALGTDLHWQGTSVLLNNPLSSGQADPNTKLFIPLPGYLFFQTVPLYASMRVWMRYGIFVNLFTSVLAGFGITWLLGKARLYSRIGLASVIFILVLIDLAPGRQPLVPINGRPIDTWLAAQTGKGACVQFPIHEIELGENVYYTLIHNKPFLGGLFSAFPPPQFQRIEPVLARFPDRDSVKLLRELGVQWVMVDSAQYPEFAQTQSAIEALGLSLVTWSDKQYLYELK